MLQGKSFTYRGNTYKAQGNKGVMHVSMALQYVCNGQARARSVGALLHMLLSYLSVSMFVVLCYFYALHTLCSILIDCKHTNHNILLICNLQLLTTTPSLRLTAESNPAVHQNETG